jgi:hypothetical protein
MRKLLYIAFLANLIFAACTSEDIPGEKQEDKNIEISLSISDFKVSNTTSRSTRATQVGSAEEQQITNLYLFLFDSGGAVEKYNVTGSTFTGGTWNATDAKVSLNLTQMAAATRNVYVVANYHPSMLDALNTVTTITGLEAVVHNENTPWSTTLNTPILMTGSVIGHNFVTDRQLNNVPLIRTVAKLELNIKLKAERQSTPTIVEGIPGSGSTTTVHQYKYQFIDFDKRTYVYKQSSKPNNLMSFTDWANFTETDDVAKYTLTGNIVTDLTITTYLNERDTYNQENPRTSVELSLPYISDGPLPPPEFGDENYKLPLPTTIERNTWYVYDIEI